jgi:lysozyme
MDYSQIKKRIAIDEGKSLTVYKDPLGLSTVGIGHLVLEHDHLIIGQRISEELCQAFFEQDFENAIDACRRAFKDFNKYPESIRGVLINMAFNLGINRLLGFKKFIAALSRGDYKGAAKEMENSRWFEQVGKRAQRLRLVVLDQQDKEMMVA